MRPDSARLVEWRARFSELGALVDTTAWQEAALGERFTWTLHKGAGHGMGDHITVGPMNPEIADAIADDVAEAAKGCR